MSFTAIQRIMTWRLPPTPKAVLVLLAYHENQSTRRCDPSVAGLMAESGLSERAVRNALGYLHKVAAVEVEHHPGRRSAYRIADSVPLHQMHHGRTCTPAPRAETPAPRAPEPKEPQEPQRCAASSPLPGDVVAEATVMVGPTFKTKGADWRLTTAQHASLAAAHPGRDIATELRKAALWCEADDDPVRLHWWHHVEAPRPLPAPSVLAPDLEHAGRTLRPLRSAQRQARGAVGAWHLPVLVTC